MKAIAVLALFISAVFAQTLPLWTDLTNGTSASVTQVATTGSDSAAERVQTLYRIWVPANTLEVTVDSTATDGTCSDPEIMIASRGPTCHYASGDWDYGIVPCSDYYETTSSSTNWNVNDQSSLNDERFGAYWFIGVRKYTGGLDRDHNCVFATTVTITTCPTGQVSIGSTPGCVTPIAINASHTYALTNVTTNDLALVYQVSLPTELQRIEVLVYSDDSSLEAAGWTELQLTYGASTYCYTTIDSTAGLMNLTCFGVRAGNFFVGITSSSSTSGTGNITVNTFTCPAGFSGLTCSDPVAPFNTSLVGGQVRAYTTNNYPQNVYYVDYQANDTVYINITVSATTGYMIYRKDVAPYYSYPSNSQGGPGYYNFDDAVSLSLSPSLFITPRDSVVGGRHYFAIVNIDTNPLNYTFSVHSGSSSGVATAAAATTGAATTGAATTGAATTGAATTGAAGTTAKVTTGAAAATTGGKNSASLIAAPLVLMVAIILALVF